LIAKGVVGVRRIDKQELRRIARSCGATIITTMANDDGEGGEGFDESLVGHAGVVYEDTVGDMDYLFIEVFFNKLLNKLIRKCKDQPAAQSSYVAPTISRLMKSTDQCMMPYVL